MQRLEHATYQQIVTALAVSGQPAHEADGAWRHVPGEPDAMKQTTARSQEEPTSGGSTAPAGSGPDSTASGAVDAMFPALQASADPAAPLLPSTPVTPAASGGIEHDGTDSNEELPTAAATPETTAPAKNVSKGRLSQDEAGPEIRVLGPVEADGVGSNGHGPRTAQLAALLYFRPGRAADALCTDMDPARPWSTATLNARLQGLRRALGNDAEGDPYVPRRRNGDSPYQLADTVRCDWTRFVQLVEHALPQGPAALSGLEKALSLVRGRPFGPQPPAWAAPYRQEMISRIVDVAHTVATHRTRQGPHRDLGAARKVIALGLDVDETAELLHRDLMMVEQAAGSRAGLHAAITRAQQTAQALDCDLELETTQLISELLSGPGSRERRAR
ncbi:AfsR/SARP family transcriptional regulator [Streptomyces sp. Tue6028]|uniref:AfsR/SARP family transcriptional regulator n=1 Tax=Streptomyces sp. Tue6028 TaxID=2036037 RepID=UPI003D705835